MNRRDHAFRVPLAEHPDSHFLYESDLEPVTWLGVLKFAAVAVIFGLGLFTLAFLVAIV